MPSEGGLFNTQFVGPRSHDVRWNSTEPVLNLRDERVIFETKFCGEIDLRQSGFRSPRLQPIPSLFSQLPRFRQGFAALHSSEIFLIFATFHDYETIQYELKI